MKGLENVSKLFQDQESTKVVSTISKEGELHAIVAGGVFPVDDNTLAIAEVFMKTTSRNMADTNKVAVLVVKGMESYLLNGTVEKCHTEGPLFDSITEKFATMNLQLKGLWTMKVDKVCNESAGPDGGKQLA